MKTMNILLILMALQSLACKKESKIQEETAITDSSSKEEASTSSLLWSGTAASGTSVFKALEFQNNDESYTFTSPSPNGSYVEASSDATEGTVWHFHKAEGDRRVEARGAKGITVTEGTTYYIGYRFKLAATPAYGSPGYYHAIMQWKTYGTPNNQNYPVLFVYNSGYVVLQHFAEGGGAGINLFKQAVSPNVWYSIVIKIKAGSTASTGNVQVYWGNDSTAETLLTGGTSYTCKTLDGTSIDPKWGYYHETNAAGDDYFSRLKIGTSWADVKPY